MGDLWACDLRETVQFCLIIHLNLQVWSCGQLRDKSVGLGVGIRLQDLDSLEISGSRQIREGCAEDMCLLFRLHEVPQYVCMEFKLLRNFVLSQYAMLLLRAVLSALRRYPITCRRRNSKKGHRHSNWKKPGALPAGQLSRKVGVSSHCEFLGFQH